MPPTTEEISVLACFSREQTAHLTDEEQVELDLVLLRLAQAGAFCFDGKLPRPTPLVRHHIDVGDARPFRAKMRRYSILELETLWKEVDRLLRLGVIEPAASPWNSPLLLVPKPDGRLRVVQDLRAVNKAVVEHGDGMDAYPLPRTDEMHNALDGAVYFSSADAQDGFWQIELDRESRPITAFQTRWGQFQWTVGTMGLMRMPATFQRMMELAVGHDALWVYALVYIDDVLIFSRTFQEHLEHVERVFTRLAGAGVVLKPTKCHFAQLRVKFLGHIVHGGGREVDPAKVAAIDKLQPPRNIAEARSYLQMASYYREYIPHYSDIAEPITAMLRKEATYELSDDVVAAWAMLKDALRSAPLLAHPDYEGIRSGTTQLVLQTDASDVGLGAVLSQRRAGGEQPLAYYSRTLNKAERNYSVYDREALAAVEAVLHFRPLLHNGRPFILETDHAALKYLLNPTSDMRTKRQERYVTVLQEYAMTIVYRPGHKNANADALSRLVEGSWQDDEPRSSRLASTVAPCACITHCALSLEVFGCFRHGVVHCGAQEVVGRRAAGLPSVDEIATAQRNDAELGAIMAYLEGGVVPAGHSDRQLKEIFAAKHAGYYVAGGRLYISTRRGGRRPPEEDRLVIPKALIPQVLHGAHDDPIGGGHCGFDRTYAKVAQRYQWVGMYASVAEHVLKCPVCLARKLWQQTNVPVLGFGNEELRGPFDIVGVDVVGPFPVSDRGNRYIVVFTDYLTRRVEAFAVPVHIAAVIARLLVEEIVSRHGAPRVLLSDNGAEFRSTLLREVTKLVGTSRRFSSPYHPQCNGLTKRANGSLVALLSMIADSGQRDWDERLPMVLFSHRTSPNLTFGISPLRLLYGQEAVLPFEAALNRDRRSLPARWRDVAEYMEVLEEDLAASHELVRDFLREQQQLRELAANSPEARHRRYAVGERVWVYHFLRRKGRSPKLTAQRWFGPYVIERRVQGSDTYLCGSGACRGASATAHV